MTLQWYSLSPPKLLRYLSKHSWL